MGQQRTSSRDRGWVNKGPCKQDNGPTACFQEARGAPSAYLQLEIQIRNLVRRFLQISGRPFEAVRADDGVSRQDECISTGREMPRSSPRGLGDISEPFSEVVF